MHARVFIREKKKKKKNLQITIHHRGKSNFRKVRLPLISPPPHLFKLPSFGILGIKYEQTNMPLNCFFMFFFILNLILVVAFGLSGLYNHNPHGWD